MVLTQKDFDQIEDLTRGIVKEEIENLPTKKEFFLIFLDLREEFFL